METKPNPIKLNDLLHIVDEKDEEKAKEKKLKKYKTIFHKFEKDEPLERYIYEENFRLTKTSWHKNELTRDFVVAFTEMNGFRDKWLFIGVFKVNSRKEKNKNYEIEEVMKYNKYVNRLIVEYSHDFRNHKPCLETVLDEIYVSQILENPFNTRPFCGYENLDLAFVDLEPIIKLEISDWKSKLEVIKGIYILTDTTNRKALYWKCNRRKRYMAEMVVLYIYTNAVEIRDFKS